MLLTSSQVSVAISSFVVFLFTSALFLSGYVLQQQTVRDLRAAIAPKPIPSNARLYLPTQFALQPTPSPKAQINGGLEELSGEMQDLENSESATETNELSNDVPGAGAGQPDAVIVEGAIGGKRPHKPGRPTNHGSENLNEVTDQKPMTLADEKPPSPPESPEGAPSNPDAEDTPKKAKPLSRAERRKKIKEEIMAAGDGEGFKGYKRRQW